MQRATERFHTRKNDPMRPSYDDAAQEVHARSVAGLHKWMGEELAKSNKKGPAATAKIMKQADAKYQSEFVEAAKYSMKRLKKTHPEEYGMVNRHAKGDMYSKYGSGWQGDFKKMLWNYDELK